MVKNTSTRAQAVRRCRKDLGTCQVCHNVLNDENWSPSMRGETGQRPRHICKGCWTQRQRQYSSKKDPDELRALKNSARVKRQAEWTDERKETERLRRYDAWLRRRYGITLTEYNGMYETQGGRCCICESMQPKGRGGFHVDHCHSSGKIRGLLCAACNLMLGMAKDNKDILMKAIRYISTESGV